MRKYTISARVSYRGYANIKMEIEAEDRKQAESKFDDIDLDDFIDECNMDADITDFKITPETDEEADELPPPRCKETMELF